MKRVLVALMAVIFAVSTAAVYANCGSCAHGDKDKGCQKADPNSK